MVNPASRSSASSPRLPDTASVAPPEAQPQKQASQTSFIPTSIDKPAKTGDDTQPRQPLALLSGSRPSSPTNSLTSIPPIGAPAPDVAMQTNFGASAGNANVTNTVSRTWRIEIDNEEFRSNSAACPFPAFPAPQTEHIAIVKRIAEQSTEITHILQLESKKLTSDAGKRWEKFKDNQITEFKEKIPKNPPLEIYSDPAPLETFSRSVDELLSGLQERRSIQLDKEKSNSKEKAVLHYAESEIIKWLNYANIALQTKNELFEFRNTVEALKEKRSKGTQAAAAADEELSRHIARYGHLPWEALTISKAICKCDFTGYNERFKNGKTIIDFAFNTAIIFSYNLLRMPLNYNIGATRRKKGKQDYNKKAKEYEFTKSVDLWDSFTDYVGVAAIKWDAVRHTFHDMRDKQARGEIIADVLPSMKIASTSLDEMLSFISSCPVSDKDELTEKKRFFDIAADFKEKIDICIEVGDAYLKHYPVQKQKRLKDKQISETTEGKSSGRAALALAPRKAASVTPASKTAPGKRPSTGKEKVTPQMQAASSGNLAQALATPKPKRRFLPYKPVQDMLARAKTIETQSSTGAVSMESTVSDLITTASKSEAPYIQVDVPASHTSASEKSSVPDVSSDLAAALANVEPTSVSKDVEEIEVEEKHSFPEDEERLEWFSDKLQRMASLIHPQIVSCENVDDIVKINKTATDDLLNAKALLDDYKSEVVTTDSRRQAVEKELLACMDAAESLETLITALDRHDREFPGATREQSLRNLQECLGRAAVLEDLLQRPAIRIPSQENVVELNLQPKKLEAKRLSDGSIELFLKYSHANADGKNWLKKMGLPYDTIKAGSGRLDYWSLHVHLSKEKFPSMAFVDEGALKNLRPQDLGFASFVLESSEGKKETDTEAGSIGRGFFSEFSKRKISPNWILQEIQKCVGAHGIAREPEKAAAL